MGNGAPLLCADVVDGNAALARLVDEVPGDAGIGERDHALRQEVQEHAKKLNRNGVMTALDLVRRPDGWVRKKDLQSRCRPAVYPVRPYFRLRRRRRSEAGRPLVSKARNSCSNSGPSRICSTALILAKSLRPITWPLDFVSVALTIFLAMGSLYQYPLSPEPPHDLAARATPAVAATSFSVRGVRPSGWPGR